MTDSRWIELDGAVNVRDLGGLPASAGRRVQPNRLIRSDNLQGLTPSDVRRLVEEHDVRAVADLRTDVEVDAEGPGPMTRERLVRVEHFSLFPEAGRNTDVAALDEGNAPHAPVVLPWQNHRSGSEQAPRKGAAAVYLGYLTDRADSAVAALRWIAGSADGAATRGGTAARGATIVHCAAGKDRTGVVTALALAEVGVPREAIVADYALSADRIEAIFGRLLASATYADDLAAESIDKHRPRPETMDQLLDAIDNEHGGVPAWLRAHGWTDRDSMALQDRLLL